MQYSSDGMQYEKFCHMAAAVQNLPTGVPVNLAIPVSTKFSNFTELPSRRSPGYVLYHSACSKHSATSRSQLSNHIPAGQAEEHSRIRSSEDIVPGGVLGLSGWIRPEDKLNGATMAIL